MLCSPEQKTAEFSDGLLDPSIRSAGSRTDTVAESAG